MTQPVSHAQLMEYWTLDLELADATEADVIANTLRRLLPVGRVVNPIDPATSYTMHLDVWTVRMLRDALLLYARHGGEVGGMLNEFEDWLATTSEV